MALPVDVFAGDAANETYGCDNPKYRLIDWIEWSLIPSFVIIGIFAYTQPRKHLWPNCCSQRPSIAFPVNLIDAYEESWMFAFGFAIMVTSVLDLFTGNFYYNPDVSDFPSVLQGTVWMCIAVVNVIQVSLAYYPILLCLTNIRKHPAKANVLGLCYTLVWTYYYVYRLTECPIADGLFGKINVAMLSPIYISYLVLNGRFIIGIIALVQNLLNEKDLKAKNKLGMSDDFKKTHFYERVKFLLTPPSEECVEKKNLCVRFREKLYPSYTGFKFSRRMVCTSVLVGLALYELGLVYLLGIGTSLDLLNSYFQDDGQLYDLFELANATDTFYEIKFVVGVLDDTFWPSTYIALAIMAGFAIHIHLCYRVHTLQLWRGDRSFCPKEQFAFSTKVVASLRFSGYHIGFSLWGALLLQFVMWLLSFFVIVVIINPWVNNESNIIIQLIEDYWLASCLGLAIYYGQVLYARLVFLIGKGEVLGLDNRRIFHVTVYITLFLNAILGLVSCLMRILKAVMFGLLFIGRVDRCTLMRGFELWDPGFKAYIGFMELEEAHTHPVMITFVHMLWEALAKRKKDNFEQSCIDSCTNEHNFGSHLATMNKSLPSLKSIVASEEEEKLLRRRRARNRWFVAITLMNNRQLTVQRQPLLPELEAIRSESRLEKAGEHLIKDDVENLQGALVGAAASFVGFVFPKKQKVDISSDIEATETNHVAEEIDEELTTKQTGEGL